MDKDLRDLFIGLDKKVAISNQNKITAINFDNAATTPAFKSVLDKILKDLELYGSIGRGLGQKSEHSTKEYCNCREYILNFFNASKDKYTAIFVNNTTDGINRLANMLIQNRNDIVITTRMEHHSNDLPWRRKCNLKYVEVDEDGRLKLDDLKYLLEQYNGQVKYVTVTAASNVTGYINDIHSIAKLVHKYNAKLIVDGAQIVAHKKVNISGDTKDDYIDFLVFSAHKMYAPFGCGAIIGPKDIFDKLNSDLKGGGTVDIVLDDSEILLPPPEKDEAGSPNYLGVTSLVQAMKELNKIGFDKIEKDEKILLNKMLAGLKSIKKTILYGDVENISDKLGIIVFNIDGMYNDEVAKLLANTKAIAVRQGAFCAHPYVRRLIDFNNLKSNSYLVDSRCKLPGMVRVSFGLYNSIDEVDIFLDTIDFIVNSKKYNL